MYLPQAFHVEDDGAIDAFMQSHEFATIVSGTAEGLVASHVPLTVTRTTSHLVISGHVARANTHWQSMDGARESLIIFHGPHAYVSPTWYATSPAVPTWNYAVVHAYGRPRADADPALLEEHLRALVRRHEAERKGGWSFDDLPLDYRSRLLSGIVGFEMPVERLEAKFKLGQNRAPADREGTIAGLERESAAEAHSLAAFMRAHAGDMTKP
jgi:transcriptional regulator